METPIRYLVLPGCFLLYSSPSVPPLGLSPGRRFAPPLSPTPSAPLLSYSLYGRRSWASSAPPRRPSATHFHQSSGPPLIYGALSWASSSTTPHPFQRNLAMTSGAKMPLDAVNWSDRVERRTWSSRGPRPRDTTLPPVTTTWVEIEPSRGSAVARAGAAPCRRRCPHRPRRGGRDRSRRARDGSAVRTGHPTV